MFKHRNKIILILILLFTLALSACGSGISPSFDDFGSQKKTLQRMDTGESYTPESVDAPNNITNERREVKSYELGADTRDFDNTYNNIKDEVSKENGYVDNSNYYNEDVKTVQLQVFIPKDNVEKFLENIKKIDKFNLLYEREYSEDAEKSYTDIEKRLDVLEKRLVKLQELQKNETDVDRILDLEDRISNVLNEIEQLKGNKQNLDSVVKYSRINISLKEVYQAKDTNQEQEVKFGDNIKDFFKDAIRFNKDLFMALLYIIIKFGLVIVIIVIALIIYNKNNKHKPNKFSKLNNMYKENFKKDDKNEENR